MSRCSLVSLSLVLFSVSAPALAQPKMPQSAQETVKSVVEAIKVIEAFENAVVADEKPDAAVAAKKAAALLQKANTRLEAYSKVAPAGKEGHVRTAKARLGWALSNLQKYELVKRGHVMEYLQEVSFHLVLSVMK